MRRIKEVLRMHFLGGFVERQIALAAQLKKSTVHDYLVRAKQAGLAWDKAEQLNDDEIEKLLFPLADSAFAGKALPDWGNVHRELRRKGVTLECWGPSIASITPWATATAAFVSYTSRPHLVST